MKKTLVFIVVTILLASAVLSIDSGEFVDSFSYREFSFKELFADIFGFFKNGITGMAGFGQSGGENVTIWDETDNSSFPFAGKTIYNGEQVKFFANFSIPEVDVGTAEIFINFSTPIADNMTYVSAGDYWEYNVTAPSAGIFYWNVTSIAAGLFANDTVLINQTEPCLNISNLTADYYINKSGTVCPGTHSNDKTIFFEDVDSITLDCNSSVYVANDTNIIAIGMDNATNIQINNCTFENFQRAVEGQAGGMENVTFSSFTSRNSSWHSIRLRYSRKINVMGCSIYDTDGQAILLERVNHTIVSNCFFNNSKNNDVGIIGNFANVTNITSYFNREESFGAVGIAGNFSNFRNIRIYNSSGIALLLTSTFGEISNNTAEDIFIENASRMGFVVEGQNSRINNLTIKNAPLCVGDVDANNSIYTNLDLSGCRNSSFGIFYQDDLSSKKVIFENSSIRNSNSTIMIANATPAYSSSIKNINIQDSQTIMKVTGSVLNISTLELNITNASSGVYAVNSSAVLRDLNLDLSQRAVSLDDSIVSFVNVTFNKSLSNTFTGSSQFLVKWLFNVLVRDTLLNAIEGANATLRNSTGIFFSELTNASGNIPWKNVTEYTETGSGKSFQDYNLTVFSVEGAPQVFYPVINRSQVFPVNFLTNASISVLSPVNGSYYNDSTINLTYSVLFSSPDKCWFLNVSGERENLTGCANTTFTALEGLNNITVLANNTQGNITFSTISFTVDTILPTILSLELTQVTNSSENLSWELSEPVNFSLRYGSSGALSEGSASNSSFATTGYYLFTGLAFHTNYLVEIIFCDMANCIVKSTGFSSGIGNYTPRNLHIPEEGVVVQELVAAELTVEPQRSSLTPGSRYIFTIDGVKHEIKLKQVYTDKRAVFEFRSDPVVREIPVGETTRVDLDQDGTDDISFTLESIELTKAIFELKRISFKKPEEVVEAEEEEAPSLVEEPTPIEEEEPVPEEQSFIEKYFVFIIVMLAVIIAAGAGTTLALIQKKKEAVPGKEEKVQLPKASHLENIMNSVYSMLKENKTELDVTNYLEGLNLDENVIKSITFEMKKEDNSIDRLIDFVKKKAAQGKSVKEVRKLLSDKGWASNIIELATEE